MDSNTLNLIIGGLIAIISSIATGVVTNIFQERRDRKLFKYDLNKKIIEEKIKDYSSLEKGMMDLFKSFSEIMLVFADKKYRTTSMVMAEVYTDNLEKLNQLPGLLWIESSKSSSTDVYDKIKEINAQITELAANHTVLRKLRKDQETEADGRRSELIAGITNTFLDTIDLIREEKDNLINSFS